MGDQTRGHDAADEAPEPGSAKTADAGGSNKQGAGKQDAPNYQPGVDGGKAEPVEAVNSANDE